MLLSHHPYCSYCQHEATAYSLYSVLLQAFSLCLQFVLAVTLVLMSFFFSREISSSQMDFFRMLDEKIENVCMKLYLMQYQRKNVNSLWLIILGFKCSCSPEIGINSAHL